MTSDAAMDTIVLKVAQLEPYLRPVGEPGKRPHHPDMHQSPHASTHMPLRWCALACALWCMPELWKLLPGKPTARRLSSSCFWEHDTAQVRGHTPDAALLHEPLHLTGSRGILSAQPACGSSYGPFADVMLQTQAIAATIKVSTHQGHGRGAQQAAAGRERAGAPLA